jgi:predicted CXXCH cytochrome family protein
MTRRSVHLLVVWAALTAAPAAALDLLAPVSWCRLREGTVVVIGSAPGAEKGSAEWQGKGTGFRVRDGRFQLTLNLGPGTHTVRFTTETGSLEAQWQIDPQAEAETYRYHPKVAERQCGACHEPQSPPEPGASVAHICYECHPSYALRRYTHGPVGVGLCVTCHDPHGSLLPAFLRMDASELCSYCHNQPVTEAHRRRAGETPCMACHDPHGTNQRYQLKSR